VTPSPPADANYTIRQAEERDLPSIVDFEIQIARISFPEDAVDDPAVHRKKLSKAMERDREGMFVAESLAGGEIAGWLWVALNTNFLTNEPYATFRSLAVAPGPESAQVADLLFTHGIEYARSQGVSELTGKVHVANVSMRVIYRKFGFEAEHLTMKKRLRGG
jgi:ribosomal protein S18 acetylase RimI-like enzyme